MLSHKEPNFVLQFISREKRNIVRYLYLSTKRRAVDVDIVTISPFFYYICIFVLMKIIGLYKSVLWNIGYLSIAWVEYWTLTKFDFYRHKFTSRSSISSYWVPPMVCALSVHKGLNIEAEVESIYALDQNPSWRLPCEEPPWTRKIFGAHFANILLWITALEYKINALLWGTMKTIETDFFFIFSHHREKQDQNT